MLEYNNPFAPGGSAAANLVFGQSGSFTSNSCDLGGVSASTLCFPNLISVDNAGDLFVADTSNNRVLEYTTPILSGTTASHVFGQGDDFGGSLCNLGGTRASSQTLCEPVAVAADSTGNLFVADFGNNRAIKYDPPGITPGRAAFDGVAAGKTLTKTFNFSSQSLLVNVEKISLSGASAANCSQINNCPATLTPRSQCSIRVTYKSDGTNPNATLTVADDAYNSPSKAVLR